jgi:MFS family permease
MGSIADQFGRRRYLVCGSACFIGFAGLYSIIPSVPLLVATAALQGVVWSGLLAASGALFSDVVPVSRRAEGFSYWGFASTGAVAIAPAIGLKVYQAGWHWLCLETAVLSGLMGLIALAQHERPRTRHHDWRTLLGGDMLDRRVFLAALSLFMVSFGNGGINSYIVLYSKSASVRPESIFFTVFAATTMLVRLFSGRLADAVGHTRALLPSLGLAAVGLGVLALPISLATVVASALFFGAGFGTCYPSFAAYMLGVTDPARRAQTFGSILAAFDTGIGMGSIVLGAVVARYGFRPAFGLAAVIALFAIPFFLLTERGLRRARG